MTKWEPSGTQNSPGLFSPVFSCGGPSKNDSEMDKEETEECAMDALESSTEKNVPDPETRQISVPMRDALPQIFASVVAFSTWLCIGVGGGFSAVLLPQLAANDSSIPVTETEASWIASLLPVFSGVGALAAALLVDRVGRRDTIKIMTIPIFLSWAVMTWAPNVEALYASRILIGAATGMGSTSTLYVTELSHSSLRGSLCNSALLLASSGSLIAYLLGGLLHWRTAALINCVIPVIIFVALCFVPESPRWLMVVKRKEEAKRAIQWVYRHSTDLADREWDLLLQEVKDSSSSTKRQQSFLHRVTLLIKPSSLRPLFVLFGFFVFQQLSGSYILLFYTVDLFLRVGSGLDPFLATILVGAVRVFTSGLAVAVSRTVGRRPLAIISGMGMTVTMGLAGLSLYLQFGGSEWVSLGAVLLYMLASAMGFLCLPWSMIGELLPLDVRGIGAGLSNTVNHLLMFAVLKMYPSMADLMQGYGVLWFFSLTSALGVVYVFLCLPETLHKTLSQIEEHFEKQGIFIKPKCCT